MPPNVVLVTGAGRGLGAAVAADLSKHGFTIAAAYRKNKPKRGLAAFRADLSDPAEAPRLVEAVLERFGRLDAIVHAASSFEPRPVLDEDPDSWRRAFAIDLDALLWLTQAAAPSMRRRKSGRIVTFGLAGAERGRAYRSIAAHAIAKSSVAMLVQSLAVELAPAGITVNCVSPGFVGTGKSPPIPAGRPARPGEVARVVRFLLDHGYVTGAIIPVSGGYGL